MPQPTSVVVGLLSHYFVDENYGCVALSISNIQLLDSAAALAGVEIEYRILVNEKHPEVELGFTTSRYEYRRYSSTKVTLKHPIQLMRTQIFSDCDFVMNINAGDGFTDLYGVPRLFSESYMSFLALRKKVPLVIAPQTIGPFKRRISQRIARSILTRSRLVFSRDLQSTKLSQNLGVTPGNLVETIDVAFALPFADPLLKESQKLRVGLNVSGLLHRGGYDGKNYFDLAFDYKEFVHSQINSLLSNGHEVHLIAHVISDEPGVEDDYSACSAVHELIPETHLAPRFEGPIEVKSYISGMDVFTGARMHSTIAALSSGTPVIPIGYSKKLPGLFDTLNYPFYLDAREPRWTIESAVAQCNEWIEQLPNLRNGVDTARAVYSSRLDKYVETLKTLITSQIKPE